ncbi:serine/threonine protein phosphatase [Methylocystis heyeri]|uniref:Serine/threonine protein phosphatase n=1 Tax=Methylocystis heyeri TaxID=391905 RepID=A0A6B8KLA7_9HYPH|nr:serine/threonine protein phosphatase [Methylocystis heyeri]
MALAGLGTFFYASYGFSNWITGLRAEVPSVVFDWEKAIPFLAWTIIPYWTTNILYAGSMFLCSTERELSIHTRRLLAIQLVAVGCFLAFPLKVIWTKPDTSGTFGLLFESLGSFDRPFNQAPSLHVALTVALSALYLRYLPRAFFGPFLAWSGLVVASTLTTFQHHFIDLPTGALLGFLALWTWPMQGASPLSEIRLAAAPDRVALALRYGLGALLLAAIAAQLRGAALWLLWPAASLLMVSLAYGALGPRAFAKDVDGRMSFSARILFAPYLIGVFVNSRLWTRGEPRRVEVTGGVFLGRVPAAGDLDGVATVIDLCAEYSRPPGDVVWRAFPSLDLVAPDVDLLRRAADAIETSARPTLVVCALGYGRSVAALAVWLVRSQRAKTIAEALDRLRRVRPRLAPRPAQIAAMKEAAHG